MLDLCRRRSRTRSEAQDSYRPLADHFGLTEDEREATRDDVFRDHRPEPCWNNRVQWARRRLNDQGYLASTNRGYWKLSPESVRKASQTPWKK